MNKLSPTAAIDLSDNFCAGVKIYVRGVQSFLLLEQFQTSLKFRKSVKVRTPCCFHAQITFKAVSGGGVHAKSGENLFHFFLLDVNNFKATILPNFTNFSKDLFFEGQFFQHTSGRFDIQVRHLCGPFRPQITKFHVTGPSLHPPVLYAWQ